MSQYALGKLYLTNDAEVHDVELGIQWLEYAARHGSDHAAYQLGKEYFRGKIVKRDIAKAVEYLTRSAETGNQYAQFFLDRWDSLKPPSVMLSVSRLLYHMGRIFQEQAPAPSIPDGIQIDRKRLAQLREKKIAMGHKPDDHEEQSPSWTMTMG